MTEPFRDIFDGFPDWKDAGLTVDLRMADGSVVTGRLEVDDFTATDDDEVPHFVVVTAAGRRVPFVEGGQWRIASEPLVASAAPPR